jgi:hypothetical protein
MQRPKPFLRAFLFIFLLACLLIGLVGTVRVPVSAASSNIVISQVYGGGGNSGAPYTNDYVELFNLGNLSVPLTGWSVQYAGATGTTWNVTNLSGSLAPGQYYLVQLAGGANGNPLPTPDATGTTNMSATDGKVALVNTTTALTVGCPISSSVVDFVGYGAANCSETANAPAPSATTAVMRGSSECTDTDSNSTDFMTGTPNPRNTSSFLNICLKVINVTSTTLDGIYDVGDPAIAITVIFSNNVNVATTGGVPTLLLETGAQDRAATYSSGSGTSTLTFSYTIQSNDVSSDLDYVGTNSLSLNGGSITGAVGDANLTLPSPGTGVIGAGSLGVNKNIIINNQTAPSLVSFIRASSNPTNANSLVFRATFSEPVTGVDGADFVVSSVPILPSTAPTTAIVTGASPTPASMSSIYDVTISGGDLSTFNGTVGLDLSATPSIIDSVGTPSPAGQPAIDETYSVDHVAPSIINFDRAVGQAASTGGTPIKFTVTFSEPINVSSFTGSDITGPAGGTWTITDSGDHINFTLSAVAITTAGITTLQPSIQANKVIDLAGNGNIAGTSINSVVFDNSFPPTVTINQAVGQPDPTTTLPITFTVVFSEAIIASTFPPSDITQNGTATGITWSITNSGDNQNFILSATAVTGYGTLIPSIAANRVTDLVGNNNLASTSTDNTVNYVIAPTNTPTPTPSRTSTPGVCGVGAPPVSVMINEVAWGGTAASTSDEWIELYNPTSGPVNLNGWILRALDGTPNIPLANVNLGAGQFYLLERSADTVVSDVSATQIFTGDVGNSGEVLQLYNSSGVCVDTANSNGDAWPAGTSSTTFYSMERRGVVSDSDTAWITNVNSASWTKHDARGTSSTDYLIHGTPGYANWAIAVTATPSLQPTNTPRPTATRTLTPPPPPPLIAINEFVPRAGHDWNSDGVVNVGDEFIELLNHGVIPVNLSGYILDDESSPDSSPPYPLPAVTLQPGERIVFYGSATGLLLSDGGGDVRLLEPPGGQVGDAYNYEVVRHPDQSFCRLPDNGGLDDWNENCFPTPGLKNALGSGVLAPPASSEEERLCPIADTMPSDFILAECPLFGNIWSRYYWDEKGWFGELIIPNVDSQWDVFVD